MTETALPPRKSKHIRQPPFGFLTMMMGAPQGDDEGTSTPCSTILSNSLRAAANCSGFNGRDGMLGGAFSPLSTVGDSTWNSPTVLLPNLYSLK